MKKKNTLKHIAIIPDGNRRWAKKKGFQAWSGHEKGIKAFERILKKAQELKVPYITFWGGSWDNLTKRPKKEVHFLFKLYEQQFKRIINDKKVNEHRVKINAFGRWREVLPKTTQKAIEKAIKTTKNYNNYFLTFLLAYNGTDEMLSCIKKISKTYKNQAPGKKKEIKINQDLVKENLWTKDLPPVDLVIRTGSTNDPHASAGFMMWDTAYSQFHFSKTLFPDFKAKEFEKIVKDYLKKERRFGS